MGHNVEWWICDFWSQSPFFHSTFCPIRPFSFNVLSVELFYCRRFLLRRLSIKHVIALRFFLTKKEQHVYLILEYGCNSLTHLEYDFDFEDGSRVWALAKSRHLSSITQIVPANTNECSCACLLNYTYDYQNYFPGGCRVGPHNATSQNGTSPNGTSPNGTLQNGMLQNSLLYNGKSHNCTALQTCTWYKMVWTVQLHTVSVNVTKLCSVTKRYITEKGNSKLALSMVRKHSKSPQTYGLVGLFL